MNKHITSKLMSLLSRRELKERLGKVAMVLSCFAVFCITYILVAPVLTEEWPAVCGLEEHTHDDSCYTEQLVEPTPELICGLEETGHVHTDSCYTAVRGDLMCTETGTEEAPHEHGDSCYAWSYELTCTESEGGHIHDASCYAEPAEPYMERVLTCELPEHTHTDMCYHVPEENPAPEYICGFLTEHTHTEECYFEDGSLKCTVPEHTHTKDCVAVELPELGENEELMPVDEQFTYENEEVTVTFTVQGEIPVVVAETEVGTETVEATEPVETTEPALELVVTESEDQEAYNEYEELATEDGDVMLMQVLDYSLMLDGTPVDLSRCEVTTEVTPKPELQQMMDSPMPLMTYAAEDMEDGSSETETFMELTTYSESNGEVAYALVAEIDPHFTVQYYARMERAVKYEITTPFKDEADFNRFGEGKAVIINTDGGSSADASNKGSDLPNNIGNKWTKPTENPLSYLKLISGKIETSTQLTEIYKSEALTYQKAPGLMYFNIVLQNEKSEYQLKEIWILKNGKPADSLNEDDWDTYTYSSTTRFTNREATANRDSNFILIKDNAVIRLVYEPKTLISNYPVNFYDYDITNGAGNIVKKGINSLFDSGGKIIFGNNSITDNTKSATFKNNNLNNQFNQANSNGFAGAAFKMVTGLDTNGYLKYQTDIMKTENGQNVQKLFNEGSNPGKKDKDSGQYSLDFNRVGDTYTLSAVRGSDVGNLDTFNSTKHSASWMPGGSKWIHTNNFWPMDKEKGDDQKDGNTFKPGFDDGTTHNAYFGMQFAVNFDLSSNYVGPLEYYFFGDDDMWVFLTPCDKQLVDGKEIYIPHYDQSELVCDIGGVHPSIGEYVNLWDHIDRSDLLKKDANGDITKEPVKVRRLDKEGNPIPLKDKNGDLVYENGELQYEMTDMVKSYMLSFFYTERGAGGSTCWMQFTLPTVVGVNLDSVLDEQVDKTTGSLSIEKKLEGVENVDWFEFELSFKNADDNYEPDYLLRDSNGELIDNEVLKDNNDYVIADGSSFKIRAGDVLVIRNLPEGAEFTITEIKTDGYQPIVTVDGTPQDTAPVASGTIKVGERTQVVYTNHATYELPATGGSGTAVWYIMGGLLALTGLCLLVYSNKQKRGKATI